MGVMQVPQILIPLAALIRPECSSISHAWYVKQGICQDDPQNFLRDAIHTALGDERSADSGIYVISSIFDLQLWRRTSNRLLPYICPLN